jgi:hypothetical protein
MALNCAVFECGYRYLYYYEAPALDRAMEHTGDRRREERELESKCQSCQSRELRAEALSK